MENCTNERMTPEEFKKEMEDASKARYIDSGRPNVKEIERRMIRTMCDLLRDLGYGEGIDIFENPLKWFTK